MGVAQMHEHGAGLGDDRAVRQTQRRHLRHRVQGEIVGLALLAAAGVDDLAPVGCPELLEQGLDRGVFVAGQGQHAGLHNQSSRAPPSATRRRRRAWNMRVLTVPGGQSTIAAISW